MKILEIFLIASFCHLPCAGLVERRLEVANLKAVTDLISPEAELQVGGGDETKQEVSFKFKEQDEHLATVHF